jgi:hypothetical protein
MEENMKMTLITTATGLVALLPFLYAPQVLGDAPHDGFWTAREVSVTVEKEAVTEVTYAAAIACEFGAVVGFVHFKGEPAPIDGSQAFKFTGTAATPCGVASLVVEGTFNAAGMNGRGTFTPPPEVKRRKAIKFSWKGAEKKVK